MQGRTRTRTETQRESYRTLKKQRTYLRLAGFFFLGAAFAAAAAAAAASFASLAALISGLGLPSGTLGIGIPLESDGTIIG
jgi:hypothetical protein